jgi:hypothetical protein
MKILAAISVCVLVFSASYGQKSADVKKANASAGKEVMPPKANVVGYIRDAHNRPIKGVKAFVYRPDSSIVASGASDSSGHFLTNSVVAGSYYMKIVYPSNKVFVVTGLTTKGTGPVELNLKADLPEADSSFTYDALMPKPAVDPKKGAPKKK